MPSRAFDKGVCFVTMFTMTGAHVLSRTISCSLLAVTNMNWLWGYLGGDMALYFAFKAVRSDFLYFPNMRFVVHTILTLASRILAKTVVDFTVLMQLRHPQELGGTRRHSR